MSTVDKSTVYFYTPPLFTSHSLAVCGSIWEYLCKVYDGRLMQYIFCSRIPLKNGQIVSEKSEIIQQIQRTSPNWQLFTDFTLNDTVENFQWKWSWFTIYKHYAINFLIKFPQVVRISGAASERWFWITNHSFELWDFYKDIRQYIYVFSWF